MRTGVFIFVFSFLFAPILHSLLATVSTDTIYALSSLFMLISWLFLDYRTHSVEYVYEPGSNTIAISSSLLAALCLASRLSSAYHTFALLLAWTIIFALWPILVQLIRVSSPRRECDVHGRIVWKYSSFEIYMLCAQGTYAD
ncbi:unnamed protein product [Echinostoma caproni]|uniref:Uncharacterized protein n=1 Tax=Echinostoma caproni TaxID=27848 RepID=A0A3P8BT37_9TREM|nr:unnamed protein product [Echinostoma caproni]